MITSKCLKVLPRKFISSSVSRHNRRQIHSYEERRVVITGLGGVTPLGVDISSSWAALKAGKSGVKNIEENADKDDEAFMALYKSLPSRIAARIPLNEFSKLKERHFSSSDGRVMSKAMMLGVLAADEALDHAGWHPKDEESLSRTGVAVGNAMVDLDFIAHSHNLISNKSVNKLSPYFVPRILPNLTPGHIAIRYGFLGPNHSVSTACATGSHAIGDAFNFIKMNAADVMLAGGVDTCINPLSMAGFCRARALATQWNDKPEVASRPFDKGRDGFVMGEGSAVLVLEELEHARRREAAIFCEVVGYGLSCDAHHITAGRPDGAGAMLAMNGAVRSITSDRSGGRYQLWCVNAHATSTPLGDKAEITAVQKFIRGLTSRTNGKVDLPPDGLVRVTSHKGNMGHLIGACGSAETAFAALALKENFIPATINLEDEDDSIDQSCIKIVKTGGKDVNQKSIVIPETNH